MQNTAFQPEDLMPGIVKQSVTLPGSNFRAFGVVHVSVPDALARHF
jgi:hypothetical protein